MKKLLFMILLAATLPVVAEAQLGGLLNKVKNKTKQRADQKVDNGIDKTLDEIEGKKTTAPVSNDQPVTTPPATPAAEPGLQTFSRYDFIPGDQVLYYDNFEGEAIGELPTGWNTSGSGEVVTLDKYPGNWLRLHKNFIYLSSNQKEFGENYTAEFDVIFRLKNNGWSYPELRFGFFDSKEEPNGGNNFLREYRKHASVSGIIYPGEMRSSRVKLASYANGRDWFQGTPKGFESLEKWYGTPVHVAIQVQKERCRIWINEEKVFDVPKGVPTGHIMNQLYFELSHTNYPEDQYAIFISNIKVATGKPDTRHKLVEEGKFSTTGILFDFQSAVIKPESYAVVKEIATVLKDNPSIKVNVIGHTSSDGDENANMELSRKRSAAVKEMLVTTFAIDAARIETDGKGETQPVADNKTREGKALNRRVEFLKH
jgi:outer membrane protein OmpA-like peptidoglycan-associated protein